MNDTNKFEHRLALLEGVNFSPDELESIIKEIQDNQRIVAELEEFGTDTPWISHQVQPGEKKA